MANARKHAAAAYDYLNKMKYLIFYNHRSPGCETNQQSTPAHLQVALIGRPFLVFRRENSFVVRVFVFVCLCLCVYVCLRFFFVIFSAVVFI